MTICKPAPNDKKAYAKKVGEILSTKYGKKKYYTPAQVKYANAKSGYDIDYLCWAMCIYISLPDFNEYHEKIGENCDYDLMKSDMASALGAVPNGSFFDFDWFELPDLSGIFDVFD